MKEMIEGLKEEFDVIVLDGAPVLPVTDSVILSALVDRVIIVVSSGETHNEELKSVKTALDNAGANIAGVVLNRVEMNGAGYGKYSRYGKYGKYGNGYYGSYYANDDSKGDKKE